MRGVRKSLRTKLVCGIFGAAAPFGVVQLRHRERARARARGLVGGGVGVETRKIVFQECLR
jgi:hypothetical protein